MGTVIPKEEVADGAPQKDGPSSGKMKANNCSIGGGEVGKVSNPALPQSGFYHLARGDGFVMQRAAGRVLPVSSFGSSRMTRYSCRSPAVTSLNPLPPKKGNRWFFKRASWSFT